MNWTRSIGSLRGMVRFGVGAMLALALWWTYMIFGENAGG